MVILWFFYSYLQLKQYIPLQSDSEPGGTGPNFDGCVPPVNAKTPPSLRKTKGPNKPHPSTIEMSILIQFSTNITWFWDSWNVALRGVAYVIWYEIALLLTCMLYWEI